MDFSVLPTRFKSFLTAQNPLAFKAVDTILTRMKFMLLAVLTTQLVTARLHAQVMNDIDPTKAKDTQYVRVMRNQDGSTAIFRRTPSNEVLEKRTFNASSVLTMLTVYRMDRSGNPLGCKIYDGLKQELFKARYGYDGATGRLVEEQLFDARVKRMDPTGKAEMPVRRFIYTYDANGKQNKPISIVLRAGKTSEEMYARPSALGKNPFDKDPGKNGK